MNHDQLGTIATQPAKGKFTEEEVARIYTIFMETGGHVSKTAQLAGHAKSTISKYAKRRGWHGKLQQDSNQEHPSLDIDSAGTIQEEDGESGESEEQILWKLKELRELLFGEIVGEQGAQTTDEHALRISPKTLAEVVKALIDIDKRIAERVGGQSSRALDAYRHILETCAELMKDDQEEESHSITQSPGGVTDTNVSV